MNTIHLIVSKLLFKPRTSRKSKANNYCILQENSHNVMAFDCGFCSGSLMSSLEANFLQPAAAVVGTVYCDTCFRHRFSKTGRFISGASVVVQCEDENAKVSFYEVAKTDKHGEFRVFLPFYVAQNVRKIEGCSVKSIDSGEPFCSIATTAASSMLRLTLKMPGTHILSAGNFMFTPLIPPFLCSEEELSFDYRKSSGSKSGFIPPTFDLQFTEPENGNIRPVIDPVTPFSLLPWFPPMPRIPQVPPILELSLPTPRQPVRSDTSNEAPSFDEEFFRPRFGPPATLRQPLPQPTVPEPDDLIPTIPNVTPPLAIPALPTPFPAFRIPFMPRFPGFPTEKPSDIKTSAKKNSP